MTDDQVLKNTKKILAIFFCVLGVIIVFVAAINFHFAKNDDPFQAQQLDPEDENFGKRLLEELKKQERYPDSLGDDPQNTLGADTSPGLDIVNFTDYECPVSRDAYLTIRRIKEDHKDDVRIIFRDLPMSSEDSLVLSMAAGCAGEQDSKIFQNMQEELFRQQGNLSVDRLPELAQELGADKEEFKSCMKNSDTKLRIDQDIRDAQDMDVQGTPTYFIDGYKLTGDIPFDILNALVEEMINKNS